MARIRIAAGVHLSLPSHQEEAVVISSTGPVNETWRNQGEKKSD